MSFQNPWWIDSKKIYDDENVKKGKIYIPSLSQNSLILGPRQVGKTTFIKLTIKNFLEKGVKPEKILFFSCDALSKKEELIELVHEYRTLINSGEESYIFLDEITSVKDWNIGLLHLFNAGYFKNSLVYVTGSSSVNLYKETLPGRPIQKVIFYPLNFRNYFNIFYKRLEVPTVKVYERDKIFEYSVRLLPYISELNKALLEYVKKGGYFATNLVNDPISLYEIYKDAILSEILKANKDELLFKQIVRKIVESIGSRISDNTIAKEISVSHNTVSDYLETMEKLFIIRIFRKKEIDTGKINFKSFKKVYFLDPFLFRVMKRYSIGGDLENHEIPILIEGVVGEHLAREYGEATYTFFKSGKEIDFLVGKIGIEVKWERNIKRISSLPSYVLSLDEFEKKNDTIIIPTSIFLYLISSDRIFYELT